MEFNQDKFNNLMNAATLRVVTDRDTPFTKAIKREMIAHLMEMMIEASCKLGFENAAEMFRASADAFELAVKEMKKELGMK